MSDATPSWPGFTYEPNPGGSFISQAPPPPSSLSQFVALEVVIDYGRPTEHTVEHLFNLDQIIHFGGPSEVEDTRPGYWELMTTLDSYMIKGDWLALKSKLQTIATVWDLKDENPENI